LKSAETVLFASRYYLRKRNDFIENIVLALETLPEQGTALRLMRDDEFNDSELPELIPIVVDIAIDGNIDNQVIARQVLLKYRGKKVVRDIFYAVVDKYFSILNEFICRGLAKLSVEAGFDDVFAKLMSICKNNDNSDIAEIYDDFSIFLEPNRPGVVSSKCLIR